eukprot:CAMPEP_0201665420 /NCGR_PEP_ID=MMETSP0494-20130426/6569_1 /ASSEMBLY_ACC=CAM_ASM_000839 /TAXON_ID=420259 /ORGANISM="Thalassiosira gravida, Strain GMp14c1" /LENGTH=396 /DNA_ID=CAMNT_0048144371 /DNA_START=22 /DNA_END=1212 /DNA_ORIENTATION=+
MATAMDSADEAGGEAVFTSDGLPSLTTPLPPPPLPSIGGASSSDGVDAGGAQKENADAVIEDESDPRVAFKSFGDAGTGWMGLSDNASAAAAWEDPRRRLFRLKSEIDALEATLAEETRKEGGSDDGTHAMALELKIRLNTMGMADSGSLATMLRGRQEDLSRVIAKDLEKFGSGDGNDLSKAMNSLTLSGETKEEDGKIVYELYRSDAAATTIPRQAILEERLRKLELAMGSSSDNNQGKSVIERIEEAERLSREVTAKQVEKLAAKAKVVRADLEAAARAKAKLASKSNKDGAGSKEDAKSITALHSQMAELEGVSAHLPAVAVRLVELSNLHASAAEFASRLDAAEAAVGRSEGVLTSVEEALGKMEGGWKDNLEGVEKNLKRLDELLAKQSS